jgi:hypothetical protein
MFYLGFPSHEFKDKAIRKRFLQYRINTELNHYNDLPQHILHGFAGER